MADGRFTAIGPVRTRKVSPHLRRIDRKVRREVSRLAGLAYAQLAPREAVRMAYNVLLRREPDEPAWTEQADAMGSGILSHDDVVDRIRCSSEFRNQVPIGAASLHSSLHASRAEFIIGLPPARRIVDLGGGHTIDPRGALVVLGYPYDFDELVVVVIRSTGPSASDPRKPLVGGSATSTARWRTSPSRPTSRWISCTADSRSST
jgi:hypothetical protein